MYIDFYNIFFDKCEFSLAEEKKSTIFGQYNEYINNQRLRDKFFSMKQFKCVVLSIEIHYGN